MAARYHATMSANQDCHTALPSIPTMVSNHHLSSLGTGLHLLIFVSPVPSENTVCGKHPVNVCWRNSLINYVINQDVFIFPSRSFTNYSYREFIPQHSASQVWLPIRRTWGAFRTYRCQDLTPDQQNPNLSWRGPGMCSCGKSPPEDYIVQPGVRTTAGF